jgi:hypothetical protein
MIPDAFCYHLKEANFSPLQSPSQSLIRGELSYLWGPDSSVLARSTPPLGTHCQVLLVNEAYDNGRGLTCHACINTVDGEMIVPAKCAPRPGFHFQDFREAHYPTSPSQ